MRNLQCYSYAAICQSKTRRYTLTHRNALPSLSVLTPPLLSQAVEQERRTVLLHLSFSAICSVCRAVQAVSLYPPSSTDLPTLCRGFSPRGSVGDIFKECIMSLVASLPNPLHAQSSSRAITNMLYRSIMAL